MAPISDALSGGVRPLEAPHPPPPPGSCQQAQPASEAPLVLTQLPAGLVNLGNSCYMNSALQALAASQHVCRHLAERAAAVRAHYDSNNSSSNRCGTAASTAAPLPRAPPAPPVPRRHLQHGRPQVQPPSSATGMGDGPGPGSGGGTGLQGNVAAAAASVAQAAAAVVAPVALPLLQGTASGLARAWLWLRGWEPSSLAAAALPPPHLAAAVAAAATAAAACGVRPPTNLSAAAFGPSPRNSELRRLSACEVLLQLDATLSALQPRYRPAAATAAATAGAPVDPSPLLRVLRGHLPGGVLALGEQNDAAEALEILLDAAEDEAAAWHLTAERWRRAHAGLGAAVAAQGPAPAESVPAAVAVVATTTAPAEGGASAMGATAGGGGAVTVAATPAAAPAVILLTAHAAEAAGAAEQLQPPQSPLRGLMARTLTCTACGSMSTTQVEPFWSLQLPLPTAVSSSGGAGGGGGGGAALRRIPAAFAQQHQQQRGSMWAVASAAGAAGSSSISGISNSEGRRSSSCSSDAGWRRSSSSGAYSGGLLTLQHCLRGVSKVEKLDGVTCARCSLAAAARRCGPVLVQQPVADATTCCTTSPAAPAGAGPASAPVHATATTTAAAASATAARERLARRVDRLAGLLAAPHLPDLDLDRELAELGAAATAATAATAAAAGGADARPCAPPVELQPVRQPAWRRTAATRPPRVLALQLLRGVWDEHMGRGAKDTRHVAFPLVLPYGEVLEDLGGSCSSGGGGDGGGPAAGVSIRGAGGGTAHEGRRGTEAEEEEGEQEGGCGGSSAASMAVAAQPPYELVAVVVHLGGAASGHYLVYRRVRVAAVAGAPAAISATAVGAVGAAGAAGAAGTAGCQGRGVITAATGAAGHVWLRVSDSSVCRVEAGEVLRQPAALLLYEQRRQ
ncbi:hypothetical protein HXX76_007380 [Chlamydomonas incerta]|uniref:Ubiquitin carboxyl-terminal hydrolase n=1 Tax=Chlamydomonas incerta TaxID=51695 RepID=A0A835TC74_CHLIN|nr:hypothetical protein HXX76_007380 [Chlamydomonas incerta]|eukprot:KAG2435305.1 hypothetical protein HXX76_007380 [Chlamydomonas incerta]